MTRKIQQQKYHPVSERVGLPTFEALRESLRSSGAAERTRTSDPIITNDVLYQLSYSGYVVRTWTFWFHFFARALQIK